MAEVMVFLFLMVPVIVIIHYELAVTTGAAIERDSQAGLAGEYVRLKEEYTRPEPPAVERFAGSKYDDTLEPEPVEHYQTAGT